MRQERHDAIITLDVASFQDSISYRIQSSRGNRDCERRHYKQWFINSFIENPFWI